MKRPAAVPMPLLATVAVVVMLLLGAAACTSSTEGITSESVTTPTSAAEPTPVPQDEPAQSTDSDASAIDIDGPLCIILTDRHLLDAEEIPCTEPHDHQLYAVRPLTPATGATENEILEATQDICVAEFRELTGVSVWLTVEELSFDFVEPSPFDLDLGLGKVGCVVFYPEDVTVPLGEIDPERAFGHSTAAALQVGDCSPDQPGGGVTTVRLVSCSEGHSIEVFYAELVDGASFPGTPELQQRLDLVCADAAPVGTAAFLYVHPSEQTWNAGDRSAVCFELEET